MGEAIDGATVFLTGIGQTAITNPQGRFTFPSLPPGPVELQVQRLGYADGTGRVEIERGRITETRVALSTEPIALEAITVTAVRRRIELPGLEDFERRYNSGWGKFILEEEIQTTAPHRLTQILREAGVDVLNDGRAVRIRRTRCASFVYVDDVKLTRF